jgi:hypothetical protein
MLMRRRPIAIVSAGASVGPDERDRGARPNAAPLAGDGVGDRREALQKDQNRHERGLPGSRRASDCSALLRDDGRRHDLYLERASRGRQTMIIQAERDIM